MHNNRLHTYRDSAGAQPVTVSRDVMRTESRGLRNVILTRGSKSTIDPWTGREYRTSTGMANKRLRLRIAMLVAAPTGFLVSYGFVEIVLRTQGQFGRGDLRAFWLWNALFGLSIAIAEFKLSLRLHRGSWRSGVSLSAAAGALVAVLFSLACLGFLGSWFLAWSFPVFYAWLVGGATSLALSSLIYRRWANETPSDPPQPDRR